jgi:hypothetical protein
MLMPMPPLDEISHSTALKATVSAMAVITATSGNAATAAMAAVAVVAATPMAAATAAMAVMAMMAVITMLTVMATVMRSTGILAYGNRITGPQDAFGMSTEGSLEGVSG